MNTIKRLIPAVLLGIVSSTASAAAFQLLEQNSSGLGVAYAGSAASAENASTIFFNPAGMTKLQGAQVSLGVNAIGPSYKFSNQGSGASFALNGSDGGDAGGWAGLPNAYVSWQLSPQWFVGLGVTSPFGLVTEYDDPNWIGRYHAVKSEITTINVNPSLAYQVSDLVSLGFGLNYQRIMAEMSNQTALGLSTLKGDDSAWGWNTGALFSLSPAMRVGVSYRSAIKYQLEGTQKIGALPTLAATAKLKLPDTFILSVWQQVSNRWEAMGDLSYTNWSTLDQLKVVTAMGTGVEPFGYKDSWRFAWGAAYKFDEAWKLKFGLAYDRTPVKDETRSARVPDNNRIWLSFGAQWKPAAKTVMDLGYTYLYVKDAAINQIKPMAGGAAVLNGRYKDSAHILGVQYSQGF